MIIQVSSHRRSGTHALIDSIRKNFTVQGEFYHLEDILDWPLEKLKETPLIVKTHEPEPEKKLKIFIQQRRISEEKAQDIANITTDLHAYRHPKDVLRSLYYFNIKGHEAVYKIPEDTSFLDFIKQEGVQDADPSENRINFWQRCIENWVLSNRSISFDYVTIVENQKTLLDELSFRLGLKKKYPLEENAANSTAIGRETTKKMAKEDLWSNEAYNFFQNEINNSLLLKLKLDTQ